MGAIQIVGINPAAGYREVLCYERSPGAASRPLPASYRRHDPQDSPLYQIVLDHLETLIEDSRARTEHGFGYPRFIEQTFRDYLTCGLPQAGFSRVRCKSCGFERLLAFSCKRRGLCPSCEARRMADTAAHLVDRVLPAVQFRQWVLSLPMPLRLPLARDAALRSRVLSIFLRRIFAWQRHQARKIGIIDGKPGAITFIQLFGGAINLNPHYHSLLPDGLFFLRPDGAVQFAPLLAPTDKDVDKICTQVARRVIKLLEALDDTGEGQEYSDNDRGDEPSLVLAPLPALPRDEDRFEHPTHRDHRCALVNGFSLHANVSVGAHNRAGLERLCRYGLRSSFSLARLSVLDDGKVRYRLKRPWPRPGGATELLLDPVAFLRRLVALVPSPRSNQVRYHGVFAPNSSIRKLLLPRIERLTTPDTCKHESGQPTPDDPHQPDKCEFSKADFAAPERTVASDFEDESSRPLSLLGPAPDEDSLIPIRDRYLNWSSLLKRVFAEDILDCPRCHGGKMEILAAISAPLTVRKILVHLGLPTDIPDCAPARAPPQQVFDDYDDEDEWSEH